MIKVIFICHGRNFVFCLNLRILCGFLRNGEVYITTILQLFEKCFDMINSLAKLTILQGKSKGMEEDNMGLKMKKAKFEGREIKISDFKESMRGNLSIAFIVIHQLHM